MRPVVGRRVWWGRRVIRRPYLALMRRLTFRFIKNINKTMEKSRYPSFARKQFWEEVGSGIPIKQKAALARLFLALIGGRR